MVTLSEETRCYRVNRYFRRMKNPFRYFKHVARGDPPGGDDVCPVSAVATERRGSAPRARHRSEPRNRAVLVEPVRSDVRRWDQNVAR